MAQLYVPAWPLSEEETQVFNELIERSDKELRSIGIHDHFVPFPQEASENLIYSFRKHYLDQGWHVPNPFMQEHQTLKVSLRTLLIRRPIRS